METKSLKTFQDFEKYITVIKIDKDEADIIFVDVNHNGRTDEPINSDNLVKAFTKKLKLEKTINFDDIQITNNNIKCFQNNTSIYSLNKSI